MDTNTLKKAGLAGVGFIRVHALRIASGLLILAGCLFLALESPYPLLAWLVLLIPPMLGAIITALSLQKASEFVNGRDTTFDNGVQAARARGTKPSMYLIRPLHWSGAFIWRLSSRLGNMHVRAAVRVAAAAYIFAVVAFLVSVAAVIFFWLAVVAVVFWVVAWIVTSSADEQPKKREVSFESSSTPPVRGRFWRGTGWWNQELAGRVDDDGVIYQGSSWITEERIGRIDEDGTIYRGTSFWNEEEVGRIDEDGTIYKGSNWFTRERAGRVTDDGEVLKGSSWWNEEHVGKIEND